MGAAHGHGRDQGIERPHLVQPPQLGERRPAIVGSVQGALG